MKRVLLKLSGEALAGEHKSGFDETTVLGIAAQVKTLVQEGIQIAVVTGGGNFCFCPSSGPDMVEYSHEPLRRTERIRQQ